MTGRPMKTDELVAGETEQSWTSQGSFFGGEGRVRTPLAPTRARQYGMEEGPRDVNEQDSHVRWHPQTTIDFASRPRLSFRPSTIL
jgi:hypothetical protein